ncbi:hypothetical protein KP509_19G076600 [Ceratopteris richardii]|uniref:Pentatricopeptide repeat-containing protein n=1 Tax=Ceratopteris richardii TaxID=49495 RepID=A0A8T2SNQ3_CERRI|nr:hypothetical protein KP509_19G076600 [Ceratopteris richardii]
MIFMRNEQLRKSVNDFKSFSKISLEYGDILQRCGSCKDLQEGRCVHRLMTIAGFEEHTHVGNKLINMYAKCGSIDDAKNVFDRLRMHDVISWTSLIGGYAQHGFCSEVFKTYLAMKSDGVFPNRITFLCILNVIDDISDLWKGHLVHSDIVQTAVGSDIKIETALVTMYSKAGSIDDAMNVFKSMRDRDLMSCTAMICACAQYGHGIEALKLFEQMICEGIEPNEYTFTSILSVCTSLLDFLQGQKVHAQILSTSSIRGNVFVGAAVVNMYAKCGSIKQAHAVFRSLEKRDVTSWTALITGYAHNMYPKAALELFQEMQMEGFQADIVVGNALIDLFSKCGNMIDAQNVFDKMLQKDMVSWTALISGYAQQGLNMDAVEVFLKMLRENIYPDEYTVSSILGACVNMSAFIEGMEIHAYAVEFQLDSDLFVRNAIVNLYAKFGRMKDACVVFKNWSPNLEVEAWNAMISGYAQHGYGEGAYKMFECFLETNLKPDEYTFSGVLSACARFCMLKEGKEVHTQMIRAGLELNNVAGNALVDMYAACGSLKEAFTVFSMMTDRELITWSSMIEGWSQHGYGKEALLLYKEMQEESVEPDESTISSMLTACSYSGLVEEGWFLFISMRKNNEILPIPEHYASMVDLLGRSGSLSEAVDFIKGMPVQPHCTVWISLLAACRIHDNISLAGHVARYAFDFGSRSAMAYILLSNVYAFVDVWNGET